MHAAADRLEFAPPPQPGLLRGLLLALVAHLLLLLALTWGVQWKRDSQDMAAEAELWASVPQEAAPKEVVAPPPPPPPQPVVREEPKPDPKPREADIALEREKQRKQKEAEERREAEQERKEQQRKKLEAQRKQDELKKQQQEKLAAEKRKEKLEEQRVAKLREENLKRMQGLAGGSDSPNARGTAAQSSGPSASWAGRVRARVKPNIVFTDDVAGNPTADVEVRLAPDGTIIGKPRLVKSSGMRGWDDAVVRALEKTEVLPRDVDGRVHSPVVISFRLRD